MPAQCPSRLGKAGVQWRPLVGRLSPFVHRCCPRWLHLHVFPSFHGIRSCRRRTVSLLAALVVMTTVLTYLRPGRHLAPPTRRVCTLWCPKLAPDGLRWHPRAVPVSHACLTRTDLPVPCVPNASYSPLLQQPPLPFVKSFRNPCWYEPFNSTDLEGRDPNPYAHNLFSCFFHGAQELFRHLAEVYQQQQLQRQEQSRELWRLRCLPYFYIAGMPKSGSTDLFHKVMLHPDVLRPPMKEPHWWGKNRFGWRLNFSSSIPLAHYVDLFDKAAQEIEDRFRKAHSRSASDPIVLEPEDDELRAPSSNARRMVYHPVVTVDASASTFWANDEWWRLPENCGRREPLFTNAHYIHHLTPQAKVIVILRNPVDRLFSDYLYFTKTNKSLTSFHDNVLLSIAKLTNCSEQFSLRACIYDKHLAFGTKGRLRIGVYHVYLSEWLAVFPPDQLMVLRTEDYSSSLRDTMRQIFHFLGLRPLTRREERKVLQQPKANTRRLEDQKLGSMLPETRQTLQDFYRPHNQRLAQLLHDQRYLWEEGTGDVSKAAASLTEDVLVQRPPGGVERRSAVNLLLRKAWDNETRTQQRRRGAGEFRVSFTDTDMMNAFNGETSFHDHQASVSVQREHDVDSRMSQYYQDLSVGNDVDGNYGTDNNATKKGNHLYKPAIDYTEESADEVNNINSINYGVTDDVTEETSEEEGNNEEYTDYDYRDV